MKEHTKTPCHTEPRCHTERSKVSTIESRFFANAQNDNADEKSQKHFNSFLRKIN